jgi:succinate dehydrogenase/fumarate reductase flavoprotein subunit
VSGVRYERRNYDVLVIGAGAAGMASALKTADKLKNSLVDVNRI